MHCAPVKHSGTLLNAVLWKVPFCLHDKTRTALTSNVKEFEKCITTHTEDKQKMRLSYHTMLADQNRLPMCFLDVGAMNREGLHGGPQRHAQILPEPRHEKQ